MNDNFVKYETYVQYSFTNIEYRADEDKIYGLMYVWQGEHKPHNLKPIWNYNPILDKQIKEAAQADGISVQDAVDAFVLEFRRVIDDTNN